MFQTNNFKQPSTWIFRIIVIALLLGAALVIVVALGKMNINLWIIFSLLFILFILTNQVEELSINESEVIYEYKSIIPFLSYKEVIRIDQIDRMNIISDQTMNDRGFLLGVRVLKNILEIVSKDGNQIRIKDSIDKRGVKEIQRFIKSNMHN